MLDYTTDNMTDNVTLNIDDTITIDNETKTSLFETGFDSTELNRITIDYAKLSVDDDLLIQNAIQELDLYLTRSAYQMYIKIKHRKCRYIEPTKFNECILHCKHLTKNILRCIDIFDVIITFFELDYSLSWDQLSYNNKLAIAKDIELETGNVQLLEQVLKSNMDGDFGE